MRRFIFLLFLFVSSFAISQPVIPRSSPANTPDDPNAMNSRMLIIPRYTDTTDANSLYPTLDSIGKIIFTRSDNKFWVRMGSPKRWGEIGNEPRDTTTYNSVVQLNDTTFLLCRANTTCDTVRYTLFNSNKGDITVSNGFRTWRINDSVVYDRSIVNVSASKILGHLPNNFHRLGFVVGETNAPQNGDSVFSYNWGGRVVDIYIDGLLQKDSVTSNGVEIDTTGWSATFHPPLITGQQIEFRVYYGEDWTYDTLVYYDPEAIAFFDSAGITNWTEKTAINQLIINLKANGTSGTDKWSKVKVLYPFCGSSSSASKWNLKDVRNLDAAFRLTFSGGWTFDSYGVTPNGTTGYARTYFIPSTDFSANSAYFGFYSRTNTSGELFDFGANDGSGGIFSKTRNGSNLFNPRINGGDLGASAANSIGYFSASRTFPGSTPSAILYKNGVALTGANTNPEYRTAYEVYLGALNNSGTVVGYSPRTLGIFILAEGLTTAEDFDVFTAVNTFITTLGRN